MLPVTVLSLLLATGRSAPSAFSLIKLRASLMTLISSLLMNWVLARSVYTLGVSFHRGGNAWGLPSWACAAKRWLLMATASGIRLISFRRTNIAIALSISRHRKNPGTRPMPLEPTEGGEPASRNNKARTVRALFFAGAPHSGAGKVRGFDITARPRNSSTRAPAT